MNMTVDCLILHDFDYFQVSYKFDTSLSFWLEYLISIVTDCFNSANKFHILLFWFSTVWYHKILEMCNSGQCL